MKKNWNLFCIKKTKFLILKKKIWTFFNLKFFFLIFKIYFLRFWNILSSIIFHFFNKIKLLKKKMNFFLIFLKFKNYIYFFIYKLIYIFYKKTTNTTCTHKKWKTKLYILSAHHVIIKRWLNVSHQRICTVRWLRGYIETNKKL